MRICPKCGRQNSNNDNYCQGCGTKLVGKTDSIDAVESNHKEDGENVSYSTSEMPTTIKQSNKKTAVIAAILAVAMVCAGVFFVMTNSGQNTASNENVQPSQETNNNSPEQSDNSANGQPMEDIASSMQYKAPWGSFGVYEVVGIEDAWYILDRVTLYKEDGTEPEYCYMDLFTYNSSDESILTIDRDDDRSLVIFVPHKAGTVDVTIQYHQDDGSVLETVQTIEVLDPPENGNGYSVEGDENLVLAAGEKITWNGSITCPDGGVWEEIWLFEERSIGIYYYDWEVSDLVDYRNDITVHFEDGIGKSTGEMKMVFVANESGQRKVVAVKNISVRVD